MTLEEHEDTDLNPALWASQAGCGKPAKTKAPPALTRCAEIAAAIPIILLLLPIYTLIQVFAAGVCICRIVRGIHRHIIIRDVCIPDACSASQNLKPR